MKSETANIQELSQDESRCASNGDGRHLSLGVVFCVVMVPVSRLDWFQVHSHRDLTTRGQTGVNSFITAAAAESPASLPLSSLCLSPVLSLLKL